MFGFEALVVPFVSHEFLKRSIEVKTHVKVDITKSQEIAIVPLGVNK